MSGAGEILLSKHGRRGCFPPHPFGPQRLGFLQNALSEAGSENTSRIARFQAPGKTIPKAGKENKTCRYAQASLPSSHVDSSRMVLSQCLKAQGSIVSNRLAQTLGVCGRRKTKT